MPILCPQRPVSRASAYAAGNDKSQRDEHDKHPHQRRVAEPSHVARFVEEQLQVIQCGRQVEFERIIFDVVEVDVLFERGDKHPVEGKCQQHDKHRQHRISQRFGPEFPPVSPRHHATSARCAARSMK